MKPESEPVMQQPIRKTVGRPLTPEKKLAHLEDLTQFLKRHVHGTFGGREGEYYPVRKIVGRTGAKRG